MLLQWRNYIWQSLEECAGMRCSEFDPSLKSAKKGLTMKRSAFRSRSGHITFSEGCLCALSISGFCPGAICVFCTVKLNVQNGCRKQCVFCVVKLMFKMAAENTKNCRRTHNASEILQKDFNNY